MSAWIYFEMNLLSRLGCLSVRTVLSLSFFNLHSPCRYALVVHCFTTGSVELVDCSDSLPDLKRSPGLSTWKVSVCRLVSCGRIC